MRKKYLLNSCFILFTLFICVNIFSCTSQKKIKYFQDIPDSGKLKTIVEAPYIEPKVQVDDILTIVIQTIDPTATEMINSGNVSSSTSPSGGVSSLSAGSGLTGAVGSSVSNIQAGYLVDKQGNVSIPVLGKIAVVGYSTSQLTGIIQTEADKYYKNPNVIVRFANFKVSVTGEVLKPGVYVMPNEKVSILDALAMAGDLTVFGKRDNVLVIRENLDGTKTPYRIDLRDSKIFNEPGYYLKQNDFIYVEPAKGKAAANDAAQARTFALLSSLISILIVIASRIKY